MLTQLHTSMASRPPITPVRQLRSGRVIVTGPPRNPNVSTADNRPPSPGSVPSSASDSALRSELSALQSQLIHMQNQLSTNRRLAEASLTSQSREYWTFPIHESVVYPGENASRPAQVAYTQRLHAYLRKSQPIWDVVSGKEPCPITLDDEASLALKTSFGSTWVFQHKDIGRAIRALTAIDANIAERVQTAMNKGADTATGSWSQRNAAIFNTICETLDLGTNGKDLGILTLVEQSNGMALHDLISFRLREIKSTDPLQRAIRLNLDLNHIKYSPQPHGVTKYFSAIEAHRTQLADLNPPKTIHDWQVVAKVLRELPALHPKFQEAARFLSLQRKLLKAETTLQECQHAFVSADIDNDIHGDLHARGRHKGKGSPKKRLRANNSNLASSPSRRARFEDDRDDKSNVGRFKAGDCVHHPAATSHTTSFCKNPFGLRSIFGKAQSYHDKCIAVKTSVQAGWSKRATNVKIPQGYGFDRQGNPTNNAPVQSAIPTDPLRTNLAAVPNTASAIDDADMRTYHKVRGIMAAQSKQPLGLPVNPRGPPQPTQQLAPHSGYHQPTIPPVRAFQAAVSYPFQAQPHFLPQPPVYPIPGHPYAHPYASPYARHPAHVRSNAATMSQPAMPPPTDDDLIAAGMRYYATQSGHQNFH